MSNVYKEIEKQHNIYVECSDGWFEIINLLNDSLTKLSPNYKVGQIKEKFGELRYYIDEYKTTNLGLFEEMNSLIDKAIEKSKVTCEVCGKPGEIDYSQSWVQCLCEDHRKKK